MISNIKKKILRNFFYKKYFKKQLDINEKIFRALKINLNEVKKILKNSGYTYDDENLSWHYHIFAGFSSRKKKRYLRLELMMDNLRVSCQKYFLNQKLLLVI